MNYAVHYTEDGEEKVEGVYRDNELAWKVKGEVWVKIPMRDKAWLEETDDPPTLTEEEEAKKLEHVNAVRERWSRYFDERDNPRKPTCADCDHFWRCDIDGHKDVGLCQLNGFWTYADEFSEDCWEE